MECQERLLPMQGDSEIESFAMNANYGINKGGIATYMHTHFVGAQTLEGLEPKWLEPNSFSACGP